MYKNEFDFVLLSETHVTADINVSEYIINSYKMFNSLSNSGHTGGVTIFVNNRLKSVKINSKSINYKMWIIMIKRK